MTGPRIVPELACANFKESLHFYIAILGFRVRYDRPEEQFAYLDLDGAELMLTHAGIRLVHGIPSYPFGRGLNLQIEVQDIDTLYANVIAAGVPLFLPMEERWYRQGRQQTGNRQFVVSDPDGYLLRFFQDLGLHMENEDHANRTW
ncbi:bleomycin resistance protein [Paenibacillus piri]|uniref:Bleomycin resistance protein n=1 Tax=Paenibacillus piri TaxID=2547395 RepID=A0A4R5K8N9_9BACL|nr:VOC family protein [Paenibacillus piri]TDF90540.1 VOC family protein [Paenibacillus piri]